MYNVHLFPEWLGGFTYVVIEIYVMIVKTNNIRNFIIALHWYLQLQ